MNDDWNIKKERILQDDYDWDYYNEWFYLQESIDILRRKLIDAFLEKQDYKDKKGMKSYSKDDYLIEMHVFEMKDIINRLFGHED